MKIKIQIDEKESRNKNNKKVKQTEKQKMKPRYIARNGHRLHDMGLSTSRHEDDQLPCRRSRMIDICGRPRPRAACWDRDRKKIERKTCGLGKQLQPSSGRLRRPVYVQLSLSPRGFGSKYEEKKRAGFVADSTRAWSPHRIAGVEGVRLACRLQVE